MGFLKTALAALIFFMFFLGTLAPWLTRSYRNYGIPVNSSIGNYTVATRMIPSYLAWKENITMSEAREKTKELFISRGVKKEALEEYDYNVDAAILKEGLKIIAADPIGFTQSQSKFLIPYFFGTGWSEIYKVFARDDSNPPYFISNPGSSLFSRIKETGNLAGIILSLAGAIFYGIMYLFAAYAIFRYAKDGKIILPIIFMAAIILYFAISTGELSYSRYRYPVNPLIFTFAAYGLTIFWNRLRSPLKRAPAPAS